MSVVAKVWNKKKNNNLSKTVMISFYGGEPLLNMKLIKKIVNYAKTRKVKYIEFSFGMTTNGVLLEKHMDFLAASNFYLSISLDGNKKNSSYRVLKNGQPSFDKVIKNINKLKNKHLHC